jgi:hypothetical protein
VWLVGCHARGGAAAGSGIWVVSAGWQGASQANRAVRLRAALMGRL